jgi:hypothetical protein
MQTSEKVCSVRPDLPESDGAGDGNRTRMASLEGWGSAIELHPRGQRGYQRSESGRRSVRGVQFARESHAGIADGRVNLTFRLWSRPQAKVGGRYTIGAVAIEVDDMELVPFGTVTEAEARRSGSADCEALRAITAHAGPVHDDTLVYRIEFHLV